MSIFLRKFLAILPKNALKIVQIVLLILSLKAEEYQLFVQFLAKIGAKFFKIYSFQR